MYTNGCAKRLNLSEIIFDPVSKMNLNRNFAQLDYKHLNFS